MPASAPHPLPLAALPGARASCALLTLLTVMLTWPAPPPGFAVIVRGAYFALLTWFFWRTSLASPSPHARPMQLVSGGFFVLWFGHATAAVIHFGDLERSLATFVYLRDAGERGALVLLGTTLIAYGLMLWIPRVLQSHARLATLSQQQHGQLERAETERSELERQLVETDRRGMLGELAASIAHDLRNPLTVVKGTAESLCRRPRTDREVREHTAVITRNIEKADATIAALIDLARPRRPELVSLHAGEVLREAAGLVAVEARRRQTQVVIAAPHGTVLRGDRVLVAQALLNLLLNALQIGSADQRVRLVARPWLASHVALAVEDRGPGLPPSTRERLFTPFFTTREHGTGLGLLSCRRIAHELGGELRLYPRRRGGTRAILWLPAPNPACSHPLLHEHDQPCTTATTC